MRVYRVTGENPPACAWLQAASEAEAVDVAAPLNIVFGRLTAAADEKPELRQGIVMDDTGRTYDILSNQARS